jgi:protein-disulfide isomerase
MDNSIVLGADEMNDNSVGACMRRALSFTVWLIAGGLLAVVAPPAIAGFDPDATYQVPSEGALRSGQPQAAITIVEFSDYACGYCVRARETMAALKLIYPGQLRWVHRSVPFISATTLGAEAAHAAAAQGQFEAMEARLYARAGRYDRVAVEMFAQELGLDMMQFRADLDSGAARSAIEADVALARRLGVTATPTFFINGRPILGNQPMSTFVNVIDAERRRIAALPADFASSSDQLYNRLVGDGRVSADDRPRVRTPNPSLSSLTPYRVGTGLPGLQRGPSSAPVTLIVFSDFECPFCARNEPALAAVRQTFGDSVRIVFRHLPLGFHRRAQLAAEAAMAAAAQGKFWEFHDLLVQNPTALLRSDLEQYARALGLALDRFRADLDTHVHRDAVRLDAAGGMALGVDGTPTMFVNGIMLSGAQTPQQLVDAVRFQLEAANRVMSRGVESFDVYAVLMAGALGHERSDPSTVPLSRAAQALQLSAIERLQIVTAACRRGVAATATLAPLPEPLASYARAICAPYVSVR